tara:strand:+ start:1154 stop:2008 length:855 start_codon:yes stop_codon:yes gene_type:complete
MPLRGPRMDSKKRKELEGESTFTSENRERKELVTLGGTARTVSGKLTKSNYFRFLQHDLDNYEDIELDAKEAKKIHTHLSKLSTGSTAMVPIYCAGSKCPFAQRCPLVEINKAPVGRQCIIEVQLLREWTLRYFEEYEVDPNNFTEIGYINELAEIEILLNRLNMNLAKPENAELVIDQVAHISHDGTPILQKQLSPFMEQKERLQNRRSKVIKLMVGDRQERYKKESALKVKVDQDPSSQMANMRGKLEALQRNLQLAAGEGSSIQKESKMTPQDLIDAAIEE